MKRFLFMDGLKNTAELLWKDILIFILYIGPRMSNVNKFMRDPESEDGGLTEDIRN